MLGKAHGGMDRAGLEISTEDRGSQHFNRLLPKIPATDRPQGEIR
jgi:hypothetical protein